MKFFLLQRIRDYCEQRDDIDPWKILELDKILGLLSNEDQYNDKRYSESLCKLVWNEKVGYYRTRFVTQYSPKTTFPQKLQRLGDSLVSAKVTPGHVTFQLTDYDRFLDKLTPDLFIMGSDLSNIYLPIVSMNYKEVIFQLSDPGSKIYLEWELRNGYDRQQLALTSCANSILYKCYNLNYKCWLG